MGNAHGALDGWVGSEPEGRLRMVLRRSALGTTNDQSARSVAMVRASRQGLPTLRLFVALDRDVQVSEVEAQEYE